MYPLHSNANDSGECWARYIAATLCGGPAIVSLWAYLERGHREWLIAGLLLGTLAYGVSLGHRASLRAAATLFMSVGVTMPIGAASPLLAMDARTEPWLTGAVAAATCSWLSSAVLITVLGWQLACSSHK